jgi:hypothetical protein
MSAGENKTRRALSRDCLCASSQFLQLRNKTALSPFLGHFPLGGWVWQNLLPIRGPSKKAPFRGLGGEVDCLSVYHCPTVDCIENIACEPLRTASIFQNQAVKIFGTHISSSSRKAPFRKERTLCQKRTYLFRVGFRER